MPGRRGFHSHERTGANRRVFPRRGPAACLTTARKAGPASPRDTVPPCACAVDRTMASPRPGASSPSDRVVGPGERSDRRPVRLFWRDSRARRRHGQVPPTRRPPAPTPHPAGCVPDRVVQQCSPAVLASASASPATTHAPAVSAAPAPGPWRYRAATDSHTAARSVGVRRRCCPSSRASQAAGPRSAAPAAACRRARSRAVSAQSRPSGWSRATSSWARMLAMGLRKLRAPCPRPGPAAVAGPRPAGKSMSFSVTASDRTSSRAGGNRQVTRHAGPCVTRRAPAQRGRSAAACTR